MLKVKHLKILEKIKKKPFKVKILINLDNKMIQVYRRFDPPKKIYKEETLELL